MTAESRADGRWRVAVFAIAGLLIAIAVIGVAGILINRNIHRTVDDAIAHDVELEDRGDDLRVAILEVRHYHRDLLLNNPDVTRVELWHLVNHSTASPNLYSRMAYTQTMRVTKCWAALW